MNRRTAIYMGMSLAFTNLIGCRFLVGTHRAFSRSSSKKHFYQHQQAFGRLASEWASGHADDELVYNPWHEDEVRWNETSIFSHGTSYQVQKGTHPGATSENFEAAARLAGADPNDLATLVGMLRKLDVSSIHVRRRLESRDGDYVVVGLQESGADYGYLYVPSGHDEGLALISAACQKQPSLIGVERVEQIAPQWFYFEGKGAL